MGEPLFELASANQEPQRRLPGLEQLICAALADPQLAAELLAAPTQIVTGLAPALQLTAHECTLVGTITHATDIYDFAAQLHTIIQQARASAPAAIPFRNASERHHE